jgi:polar amino acid transport system substrate-binding protein
MRPRTRPKPPPAILAALVVLVAGLVAVAAACGSSSSSSTTSPSPSAGGTTTTVAGIPITSDPSLKAMLPASIVSANQIRVASDIPYPPWEYYTSSTSKQATGFDYDLSQALGAKIGIPVSFLETPFDSIILAVKGGRRDMIMSDMADTTIRQKAGITFVDYAFDAASIIVPKGNPKGVTNLNSLSGKTVVVEDGTTEQILLTKLNAQFKKAGKPQMNVLALANQPAALLAVSSGRAIGDLTDHSTAEYIAKTTNNGNSFEVVQDPAAPNGYYPELIGIGIPATDTQLVSTVQKALQDLIADGTYAKIVAKYGLLPVKTVKINAGVSYTPY